MLHLRTVLVLCGSAFLLGAYTVTPTQEDKKPQKPERDARSQPVYELRTYTVAEGRLDALHKRFKDHTIKLFEKHGIKNVAYWTITEENKHEDKDRTLVYLLAHNSREAAKESWKNFMADADWQAAWKASKADGPIVTGVKSLFLKQTKYSPEPFRAVRPPRRSRNRAAKSDK